MKREKEDIQRIPRSLEEALTAELHQISSDLHFINQKLRGEEVYLSSMMHNDSYNKKEKDNQRSQISVLKAQVKRDEKRQKEKLTELKKIQSDAREHEKYLAMLRIKELELKRDLFSNNTEDIFSMMDQLTGNRDG